MNPVLAEALQSTRATEFVESGSDLYLARRIAPENSAALAQSDPHRLVRLALILEDQGIRGFVDSVNSGVSSNGHQPNSPATEGGEPYSDFRSTLHQAFVCWRALVNLGGEETGFNAEGLEVIREELQLASSPPGLVLAFHLAVTGLVSQRSAEVRLELKRLGEFNEDTAGDWLARLQQGILRAAVLLTRKANGWTDVDAAEGIIRKLKESQVGQEGPYLGVHDDDPQKLGRAVTLVGHYHLAQMLQSTASYLATGEGGPTAIRTRLDMHKDRAIESLSLSGDGDHVRTATMAWALCRENVQNSIWTHSSTLPPRMKEFFEALAARGKSRPIIELWPAQQFALQRNVLTPYHRAILVEMPTSAGKTLLAKFVIVQSKITNPDGTIVYVVPTRALVNQVTLDLREDFSGLQPPLRVEMSVPAFELDPTEEALLRDVPDVLVTTPEKLDLLIRKGHPVTSNIAIVVADEAHNISEVGRGARLELLLGTLKRDRPHARFLLLSPFLPNDAELLAWLGEDAALPPIRVDFRPGNRVVGALEVEGHRRRYDLIFETLDAVDNTDVSPGIKIRLGPSEFPPSQATLRALSKHTATLLRERGAVLILCKGPRTAITRAVDIAEGMPDRNSGDAEIEAACAYLVSEAGMIPPLVGCLKKGVAYHHAGISPESRWLVEHLIRIGKVDLICGTTTLAQGVNFPISSVIVETLKKGDKPLSYQDFWNIAGRAGRTLMDSVGVVGFTVEDGERRAEVVKFLEGEAQDVASQLASLVVRADEISQGFNVQAIRENEGLSALLQFLAHAMRVSGKKSVADDVEEIMRSSLVYHQLRAKDPELSKRLLTLCKAYLNDLQAKPNVEGLLGQADITGFSTPSVANVLYQVSSSMPGLRDPASWNPETLFGEDVRGLTEKVQLVASIPEIHLGQADNARFNPQNVAKILRDWVNGRPLFEMAQEYYFQQTAGDDDKLTGFAQYLFGTVLGTATWGLGALEGMCLADQSEDIWKEVGYVPSLLFYGVRKREAVWLRMSGVPRVLSEGLSEIWSSEKQEPTSFEEIRTWVDSRSLDDWKRSIPTGTKLTPAQCQILWKAFSRG